MKAENLGFASAILASTCCVVPVGLALLGLGSLGVGSFIGTYHWYLTGAAVALLGVAWGYFLREKRRMYGLGSDLKNERTTSASLAFASVIVGIFLALNAYTAIGGGSGSPSPAVVASQAGEIITIPVRGMTCVSCEYGIESNVRRVDGVLEADASAQKQNVVVRAKPGAVKLDAIGKAIRAAGYEPDLGAASRQG